MTEVDPVAEIAVGTRSASDIVTTSTLHPGSLAEQARGRAVGRAIRHGADPRRLLEDGPLPVNVAVVRFGEDGETESYGGGLPPVPPSPT